jgi:hypothetical protein
MPPTNSQIWGPHVWRFFHTLIEKIKPEKYNLIHEILFLYFKNFCYKLACPECRYHSSIYINNLSKDNIKTKEEFIKVIFNFHNDINKKKNKSLFSQDDLVIYKTYSLNHIYENFLLFFKPRGFLLENGFVHKKLKLVENFEEWFKENIDCFDFN